MASVPLAVWADQVSVSALHPAVAPMEVWGTGRFGVSKVGLEESSSRLSYKTSNWAL
jgi:hypothetical protein